MKNPNVSCTAVGMNAVEDVVENCDAVAGKLTALHYRLLERYAALATEFNFRVLDARLPVDRIQENLRAQIGAFLDAEAAARTVPTG